MTYEQKLSVVAFLLIAIRADAAPNSAGRVELMCSGAIETFHHAISADWWKERDFVSEGGYYINASAPRDGPEELDIVLPGWPEFGTAGIWVVGRNWKSDLKFTTTQSVYTGSYYIADEQQGYRFSGHLYFNRITGQFKTRSEWFNVKGSVTKLTVAQRAEGLCARAAPAKF